MNRNTRIILFALLLTAPFFKPVHAQDIPTPEVTPVVIAAPVDIPADTPVVVVTPAEPDTTSTFDNGLLAAGAAIVALGVLSLLGLSIVTLGKSAPPAVVEMIIGATDAARPVVDKWVADTETTLDNSAVAELWKELDKLKVQVRQNTANIENQQPGK